MHSDTDMIVMLRNIERLDKLKLDTDSILDEKKLESSLTACEIRKQISFSNGAVYVVSIRRPWEKSGALPLLRTSIRVAQCPPLLPLLLEGANPRLVP